MKYIGLYIYVGVASVMAIAATVYAWWCDRTATREAKEAEEAERQKKEGVGKNA